MSLFDFANPINKVLPKNLILNSTAERINKLAGKPVEKLQILNGSEGTFDDNLFLITGLLMIFEIVGLVKISLGNCIAVQLNLWDGLLSKDLTNAAGCDLSNLIDGSIIYKMGDRFEPLGYKNCDEAILIEGLITNILSPVVLGDKKDNDTFIRMRYSTRDIPTSGQIQWKCSYRAISDNAKLEAA